MPDTRPVNEKKYNISKDRFCELKYRCYQYPEWREELANLTNTVKAIQYGQEGKGSPSQGSATEQLAIRRMELEEKCKIVEQTAIEASPDLYSWILKAVTQEGVTFNNLRMMEGMDCKNTDYYEARRKFYWLLDKKRWKY